MLDKINRESVRSSLENLTPHDAVAGRNTHGPQNGLHSILFLTDGPITRQDKPDIMPELLEDLGQRAAHVPEATALDERHRFRRRKQDLKFFSTQTFSFFSMLVVWAARISVLTFIFF